MLTRFLGATVLTLSAASPGFFLLLFGLFAREGLDGHGGWADGLMSSWTAALASTPVLEEGCRISLSLDVS